MIVPHSEIVNDVANLYDTIFGTWTWTLEYTVLPKKCCLTEKYTRPFTHVYKGVKKHPFVPHHSETKYASKEAFIFAQLQGKSV